MMPGPPPVAITLSRIWPLGLSAPPCSEAMRPKARACWYQCGCRPGPSSRMRAEPNTTMVERMVQARSARSALAKSASRRAPRSMSSVANSAQCAGTCAACCAARSEVSVTSFDPVEPCLPLRDRRRIGAAMAGLSGRDCLGLLVAVTDRLLIGHRQAAEPRAGRLIRFAVVVAHRRLDDPAIGRGLRNQSAIGRFGIILRVEIILVQL